MKHIKLFEQFLLEEISVAPKSIHNTIGNSKEINPAYEDGSYESELIGEGKLELNKSIPTSTKQYTWIYQTGKDSKDTAIEINNKLNNIGIKSFVSKTTGDTVAIPTKDLKKAFDEVLSGYENMKQFTYGDGTKINKSIVNER